MDGIILVFGGVFVCFGVVALGHYLRGKKYGGYRGHAEPLLRRMTRDEVVRVLQRAKRRLAAD